MSDPPTSSNDTVLGKEAKDSTTMFQFTSSATRPPPWTFSFSKPSSSTKRARKLARAQRAVDKAEAKVKRAQGKYCKSVARLVSCMSTAVDTTLDAIRTDAARDLNSNLQAEVAARMLWTLKLAEMRDGLAREVLALWRMTGLKEMIGLKKGDEGDCEGIGSEDLGLG